MEKKLPGFPRGAPVSRLCLRSVLDLFDEELPSTRFQRVVTSSCRRRKISSQRRWMSGQAAVRGAGDQNQGFGEIPIYVPTPGREFAPLFFGLIDLRNSGIFHDFGMKGDHVGGAPFTSDRVDVGGGVDRVRTGLPTKEHKLGACIVSKGCLGGAFGLHDACKGELQSPW